MKPSYRQYSTVVKSVDSVAKLPGFKSQLIHLKLCDPGRVIALCLSFPNSN